MLMVSLVRNIQQWLKEENHISSLIGIITATVCLICFGSDSFMLPTMAIIILLLSLSKRKLENMEVQK